MNLIAIEGIDGAGKGTQVELLMKRLQTEHINASTISFPRYKDTVAGNLIGQYLNGSLGPKLHPKIAALMFAVDRFESRTKIEMMLAACDVVICDRYVGSNLAHQCAGLRPISPDPSCTQAWIEHLEFSVLRAHKTDATILIDIPADIAAARIRNKKPRQYTELAADLHESDVEYLDKVREEYLYLAELQQWFIVNSILEDNHSLRAKTESEIADEIASIALTLLRPSPPLQEITISRDQVARAVHLCWCSQPFDAAAESSRQESRNEADAAIREISRQLNLSIRAV